MKLKRDGSKIKFPKLGQATTDDTRFFAVPNMTAVQMFLRGVTIKQEWVLRQTAR